MIIALILFLILPTQGVWVEIFCDHFSDGTINTSMWESGTTCATEATTSAQCSGNNDWQQSLNLQNAPFNFNPQLEWNLSFTKDSLSGVEWMPTLRDRKHVFGDFPPDFPNQFIGGRGTGSTNYQANYINGTIADTGISDAVLNLTIKHNSSGYFFYNDNTLVRSDYQASAVNFSYLFFGDAESGNTGTTLYIDQICLKQNVIESFIYFINVSIDKNITGNDSIFFNLSTTGNFTYLNISRNGTFIYNGTLKSFNDTGLLNNSGYFYYVTAFYNSTILNTTNFTLYTKQNEPPATSSATCADVVNSLDEVNTMILQLSLIILWAVLFYIGLHLAIGKNTIFAIIILIMSITLDIYFMDYFKTAITTIAGINVLQALFAMSTFAKIAISFYIGLKK